MPDSIEDSSSPRKFLIMTKFIDVVVPRKTFIEQEQLRI